MKPIIPHSTWWPFILFHSFVGEVACTFLQILQLPLQGGSFLGPPISGRSPHPHPKMATGWNPLGHSLMFLIKEMLPTNPLVFYLFFFSCPVA